MTAVRFAAPCCQSGRRAGAASRCCGTPASALASNAAMLRGLSRPAAPARAPCCRAVAFRDVAPPPPKPLPMTRPAPTTPTGGQHETIAIILGGGEESDKALFPLTANRALPAVSVGGNYRLVDIPLSACVLSDIRKAYVLTQHNSQSLNRYINRVYNLGGVGSGFVEVVATTQYPGGLARWAQGGADAVRLAGWIIDHEEDIRSQRVEHVVILPADQVHRFDLTRLLEVHRESGADVTIAAYVVPGEGAEQYGILKLGAEALPRSSLAWPSSGGGAAAAAGPPPASEEGARSKAWTVADYAEKPRGNALAAFRLPGQDGWRPSGRHPGQPGRYLASTGVMVFRRECLRKLLLDNPAAHSFGAHVLPAAMEQTYADGMPYLVSAYLPAGYWADVGGSMRAFLKANLECGLSVGEGSPFDPTAFKGLPIMSEERALPPAVISAGSVISRAAISPGSSIEGATIRDSIIGPRSIIGRGACVTGSIVMGADTYEAERRAEQGVPLIGIGEGTVVENAIVDKNARIGRNCVLANRAGIFESLDRVAHGVCIREGVVVVAKSAIMRDGTQV